jgi:hypothetical protein
VVVNRNIFESFSGIDRSIFQSLLQRHAHIHDEIEAFRSDVKKLEEQSQLMNETNQTKRNENKQVNRNWFLWCHFNCLRYFFLGIRWLQMCFIDATG